MKSAGILRFVAVFCSLILDIQTVSSDIKTGSLKGTCLQKEPQNIFTSHLFCVTRENQFKYNIFINFFPTGALFAQKEGQAFSCFSGFFL
jgi:hypothetical protein